MSQHHRIEKNVRQVAFQLSNGEKIEGEAFLSEYGAHHSGPQNVGDLLRETDLFFPVRTEKGIILVNMAQLVHAKVACKEEEDELMRLGTASQSISVNTILSEPIDGDICINLREGFERVKDYVNETNENFLRLFQAETIIYINQKFIVSIRDSL